MDEKTYKLLNDIVGERAKRWWEDYPLVSGGAFVTYWAPPFVVAHHTNSSLCPVSARDIPDFIPRFF